MPANNIIKGTIQLPGSKSISNRLAMIRLIGKLSFEIKNLSESDDTKLLLKAIENISEGTPEINVGDAGTDMRFLCAYLAGKENTSFVLNGTERMKKRPIGELVHVLKKMGADITFLEKENYPPLKIIGKKLSGGNLSIEAGKSSQFISSLLLIAPYLETDTKINLRGNIVSKPYISLTIDLMRKFGIEVDWVSNTILIKKGKYEIHQSSFLNESDWSAAGYYYSFASLSSQSEITLKGLFQDSKQADRILIDLYRQFGVKTQFGDNAITLTKTKSDINFFEHDFTDCPDIAQTIAVTCAGLNIKAKLKGLQTLRIKETDRIEALKSELSKLGVQVMISDNSLELLPSENSARVNTAPIKISTYNDHRMAMSFAPLKILYKNLIIENDKVVSKSYPKFWEDLSSLEPSI